MDNIKVTELAERIEQATMEEVVASLLLVGQWRSGKDELNLPERWDAQWYIIRDILIKSIETMAAEIEPLVAAYTGCKCPASGLKMLADGGKALLSPRDAYELVGMITHHIEEGSTETELPIWLMSYEFLQRYNSEMDAKMDTLRGIAGLMGDAPLGE